MTAKHRINAYFYGMLGKKKKRNRQKWVKRAVVITEVLFLTPLFIILVTNLIIRVSADSHLYDSLEKIPYKRVGLVLGTSHKIINGGPNPYFHNRMDAAAQLYHNNKVSYLIVSGDNRTKYYNEPMQMKQALINHGVPADVIYSDHAGLRTLDSVIRAKKIFGQDSITIISQRFHNQRAVYIALRQQMEVSAFNAQDVPIDNTDKTIIREWLAKANVFWDLLTRREPGQMGEKIVIGE
ncbi:MAG: vancomycin high temperature exclusion protein [Bacteroidales bacterium]